MTKRLKHDLPLWAMAGIPVLGYVLFGLIPTVISLFMSFSDLHAFDFTVMQFTGFKNYMTLFTDRTFGQAIVNTLISCLTVPIMMIGGLLIAAVLNKNLKGAKVFRALFFVPYICSTVAVAQIFKWLFNGEMGIINQIIALCGGQKVNFLTDSRYFMPVVMLMMTWSGMGYYIILYQAALTSINKSVLEAAELDGAGAIRKFISVVVPSISPTTFYLLVMGIIGGLQTFTWFQVVCQDLPNMVFGPDNRGVTIVYYLYYCGFQNIFSDGLGLASAIAWVLVVFVLGLTVINFKLSKKWVHYND